MGSPRSTMLSKAHHPVSFSSCAVGLRCTLLDFTAEKCEAFLQIQSQSWLTLCVRVCVRVRVCTRLCGWVSLWPHGLQPARLLCPWDSPGKNTGVGCHFLLQGIVPTQGSNPNLLHLQVDSLPLAPSGKPPTAGLQCKILTRSWPGSRYPS